MKLIGGVRMRQYRSGNKKINGGCTDELESLKEVNSVSSHGCYVPYSMDRQRVYVMSLGGNRAYGPGKQSEGFQYKPGLEFNSFSMFSGTSFYDRSSFAIELSNMREKARVSKYGDYETRFGLTTPPEPFTSPSTCLTPIIIAFLQ